MSRKGSSKENLYTSFQICDALEIEKGRFREWLERKYINPHSPADGRGTKNLFQINDVYVVGTFKYLVECGFSREDASTRTRG